MTQRPHVILTLRRTGGTALTAFLGRVSTFPSMQHEPLNRDRIWGATTRGFRADDDTAALDTAMTEHLAKRPNIKHCVEVVPIAVTRALIEAGQAHDYRFLLLTRRDEARRLLSLYLAFATGVWGLRAAQRIYPEILAGRRAPKPIALDTVRGRIARDGAALGRTLALLRHRRIAHDWLIFEELYEGAQSVEVQARRIAVDLGAEVPADDPRLAVLAQRGGQGSEHIAPHVPGAAELRELLDRLVVT